MKNKKNKGTVICAAYVSCAQAIADNIAPDCTNPLVGEYTGRGVLIDIADATPSLTRDGSNPRIISGISLGSAKKLCVIDNVFRSTPFDGSTTQSNEDDGQASFLKTFSFQIPKRGAESSKEVVEPLLNSPLGFIAVLEKKDRRGDGSFEVVGAERGLFANADGISRNENENGGNVVVTMSTKERWFEQVFYVTDYATTKTAFEALIALAFT